MTRHRPAGADVDDAGPGLRAARSLARPGTANPLGSTSRRHPAARFEDAFDSALVATLRRRGWTVRIEAYPGYGAAGWVRLFGRAILAAPYTTDVDRPGAGAGQAGDDETAPPSTVRGWRSFLTAPVAGAWVDVEVEDEDADADQDEDGRQVHRVHTDRGGYLDHRLAIDLPPGLHHLTLRTQDGRTARAPVHVVGPDSRVGLVSDIDDTVMVTRLPRPLVAAWNVLVRDENAREPVPGMADLYRALCRIDPELPVMYLSTGAWNAAPAIGRFLHRSDFPTGTLLMTDWGPTNTGWFRSGPRHKVAQLRRLFAELPQIRWVLVGDDGQRDPEIYAGAVRLHPDHVRAVLIRQLTFAEHVLAHGSPVPIAESAQAERSAAATRVPVLQGADGRSLLAQARRAGLIHR